MSLNNRRKKDIPGAEEDGYLQRFPGGIIEYYRNEKNVHRMVMNAPVYSGNGKIPIFETKEVTGLRKTLLYQVPIHNDPQVLYEFYCNEFEKAGFNVYYSDYGNKNLGKPRDWYKNVFLTGKNLFAWTDLSKIMLGNLLCYFSAEKEEENGKVYLSVFAVNHFRNNKKTGVFVYMTKK